MSLQNTTPSPNASTLEGLESFAASWQQRVERVPRQHQFIGRFLIFVGIGFSAYTEVVSLPEAAGVIVLLLVVGWLTQKSVANFSRWILTFTAASESGDLEPTKLPHLLAENEATESQRILNGLLIYRHVFHSLSWLSTIPILILIPSVQGPNELILLAVVASLLRALFEKLAESLISKVTVPANIFAREKAVKKSIDRGDLATNTIQSADSLASTARRVLETSSNRKTWQPIVWGGLPIRDEIACKHFFIQGETGSGKSVVLKDLMLQALKRVELDDDQRILINDPKGDMVALFEDQGFYDYQIINPFDMRGCAWDLQKDLATKTQIEDFVNMLFPSANLRQPFFARSARGAVAVVMNFFKKHAKSWTMRDVVLAFRRHQAFFAIAEKTDDGRTWLENQAEGGTTFANVMSEVANGISQFESLSAAWHAAEREGKTYSVTDFSERRSDTKVWVLTSDDDAAASIDLLSRYLFFIQYKKISQWEEVKHPRTWIFVDEALSLAQVPELSKIIDTGRSKGMTICLATQSHSAFEAASKLGNQASSTAVGRIPNKALLRCLEKDAEWASQQFDQVFKTYQTKSNSRSFGEHPSESVSSAEHVQKMEAVPPSFFKEMPVASPSKGVEFMVVSDPEIGGGFWHAHMKRLTPKPKKSNFQRRPESELDSIVPWNEEDLERLGIADLDWLLEHDEVTDEEYHGNHSVEAIVTDNGEDPDSTNEQSVYIPGKDF